VIRRRDFIAGIAGAAAWPLTARAQQPRIPMVGFLDATSARESGFLARAFRLGLAETGYSDGENVLIDERWAEGQYDRLPALATDLVRREVAVIASGSLLATRAAEAASPTTPIVFHSGSDPVTVGFVSRLDRPGGRLTGVYTFASELWPKRLELLHEFAPGATTIALLINPCFPVGRALLERMQTAARTLGLQIRILRACLDSDLDAAFATLTQLRIGGLVIGSDPFFNSRSEQLAALALRHEVPTIYQYHEFAASGGLMSYGSNMTDVYRIVGSYVGRILRGEKPGDLPVQQPTKVELIINLKTAKALGLTFPTALLVRADEVIE
jgi:putative tryptophan/tyrosine transport system substrate-binding protein